jgi:hypothetical protein
MCFYIPDGWTNKRTNRQTDRQTEKLIWCGLGWGNWAIGRGALRNAGEDYWPWPGRSLMQAQPLFVMIK